MASISLDGSTLVFRFKYDAGMVAALKTTVPASDRKWDATKRAWLVAPQHGQTLVDLAERHLGESIRLPQIVADTRGPETRILDCRYIGMTRDRGDGIPTALGWVGNEWAAVFPESVLREWFCAEQRPDEAPSFYAVLGIKAASDDGEIKAAYRRLAKQWHPDLCRDPDAAEQFRKLQHAYDVLRVPAMKAKYDAGLALAASLNSQQQYERQTYVASGYRSPLKCGLIMAEGREVLGRFVIERIQLWQDIVDGHGRVLVTSWPMGASEPVEGWS